MLAPFIVIPSRKSLLDIAGDVELLVSQQRNAFLIFKKGEIETECKDAECNIERTDKGSLNF